MDSCFFRKYMNNLELLSPAGDLEIFKAVVNAGADAVYFGGDLFGARAYAKNFSIEEAAEAISYAHIHQAKAYLTVNTLLKNIEIEHKLYEYLKAYVESGIDAFIVQDFGVFSLIKEYFPDTHIHASTQMTLANDTGAALIESLGAKRIVTSRELSISEIANIHRRCPDLEIESFIHGALCVSYSGQCLMSSMIGGRSGNRGRCAQPCRLNYSLYDSNKNKVNMPGDYLLSPKDFCTIEHLPEMIEAGVVSFKIEGRMKQLSYATGVVSMYRKYLDKYISDSKDQYSVTKEDYKKLLAYGNRCGFTDLYLNDHNGKSLMTFQAPSHTKTEEAGVIQSEKKVPVSANVYAHVGEEFSLTLTTSAGQFSTITGPILEASENKPATKENISDNIGKMGNTSFEMVSCDIDMDSNVFLPVSIIKNARREALANIEKQLITELPKTVLPFTAIEDYKNAIKSKSDNLFVVASTVEQFNVAAQFDFVKEIAIEQRLYNKIDTASFNGKLILEMPAILRNDRSISFDLDAFDGVLATSYDSLGYLFDYNYPKDKIILDNRLYSFSNRAIEGFNKLGIKTNCIPYELSLNELKHRDNSNSQFVVYSRIPLMTTANCQIKNSVGCNKKNDTYYLKDRKGEFFYGRCNCESCYNIIYNCKAYSALNMVSDVLGLGAKQLRIDLTFEGADEAQSILKAYESAFINNKNYELQGDFTKGHLRRGVE